MEWTLVATAIGGALSAAIYLGLAGLLWRRHGEPDVRFGTRAFAAYWTMTGSYQLLVGTEHLLAAYDAAPFELVVAVRYVGLALAGVGLAGLMTFFVYLLTGRRAWATVIFAGYALAIALAWLHVARSDPIGIARTPWSIDVAYANDFNAGPLFWPLLLTFQLVPILGTAWYLTLARKAANGAQRRRILAVGAGVGLQLLGFLVARVVPSAGAELVSRVILALGVSTLVFVAYFGSQLRASTATARIGG